MTRESTTFPSGSDACAAWVYPAPQPGAPVVVLGIGLGSIKEMGLDRYARLFQAAGFAALVFDYRGWGESSGQPRLVIDVPAQLDDWRAAIAFARTLPDVDPDRVAVWGTSFGGGHTISLAADPPPGVVAAVAQCPFTDGLSSALRLSPVSAIKVGWLAVRDLLAARRGKPPVLVATAAEPHAAGLMTSPDAVPGFLALVPDEVRPTFENQAAARIGLTIMGYRPGRRANRISIPLFAAVCLEDTVAPPKPTLRHLKRAPGAEVRTYETGHFAIYQDPWFDVAAKDQLDFLQRTLG